MSKIDIGDLVYHPCSIDIIEHKVIGIRLYDDRTMYETKATHKVGACGRVRVLLAEDKNGVLRFVDLLSDSEYESGLQDFVEGEYYDTKPKARLKYYENQEILAWSNMDNKERLFKEAKSTYEKVKGLIKDIKAEIKLNNGDNI